VKATGELPHGEHENAMGLDLGYMWNATKYISNAVHDAYLGQELRKGRMFGSKGCENYTKSYIYYKMKDLDLDGVQNITLGPIKNESYKDRYYTSFLNVTNFNLHINTPEYALPRDVPKNESYASPSAFRDYLGQGFFEWLNHNFSRENIAVRNILSINWPFGGSVTGEFLNASCESLGSSDIIIGNVTYIGETDTLPDDQEGRVLLFNETSGCISKLENVTNASGVILLHDSGRGYTVSQSVIENCSFVIQRVEVCDNMTNITERLLNGELVFADNVLNTDIVTFCFGFDLWDILWPDEDFFLDVPFDDTAYMGPFHLIPWNSGWYILGTFILRIISAYPGFVNRRCEGLIFYNDKSDDTHRMLWYNKGWYRLTKETLGNIPFPSLPVFSVNKTVGQFLNDHGHGADDDNTVSGFIDQEYLEESHSGDPLDWTAGVESYDVVGYLNISQSPNDTIVVISNRHDSHAGECPGDSGAGAGIVLGIAKYFKEYNITPKYDVTFLQTTGEEFGFRGAQYYSDTHRDENISLYIGFEQLGMSEYKTNLTLDSSSNIIRRIIYEITNQTHYHERTNYHVNANPADCYHLNKINLSNGRDPFLGHQAEDVVWMQRNYQMFPYDPPASATNCSTICFSKQNWSYHHQTGNNFSEGDSLPNTDRNDLNITFELGWNVTRYFLVNPNCWLSNISFTTYDSPNDGDTLNDSIRTNFTIHSVLPSDKVRVEMALDFQAGGIGGNIPDAWDTEYVVTAGSLNVSHIFTIPDDVSDGSYNVSFKVYNSTGIINRIINGGLGNYYNDTSGSSGWHHLYHPLGYPKAGGSYKNVHDNISGSIFTANEDGRANNITAYINQGLNNPGPYKCMLYRANDSTLIGTTTENWVSLPQYPVFSSWWAVFNFTGTKPRLVKGVQYVITCWGDNAYSRLYYNQSGDQTTGAYESHAYGTPPDPASFTPEPRYYSIYCSYTPILPEIVNVSHAPDTVGFGYNVTINTNVTDDMSGVNYVRVHITPPGGGLSANYTMTHISGNLYRYVYTNTWRLGQYNYTIWAVNNNGYANSSTGHHFHASVQAQISIATLKDSYTGNQYINITDPPNPPENYTLVGRGLDWDTYYDAVTGQNILEASAGPINYQNETGEWTPINCTLQQLLSTHPAYAYGYRAGNDHGLYHIYFKPNAQSDWPVAFAYNKSTDPTTHVIRSKLVGVGYVDPQSNWAYQYLQNVQSSQGQFSDNKAIYENVFPGTDVTWSYRNTEMKEEIIMDNTTKALLQSHPPSMYGLHNGSSYLVFITKLDYQSLNLYNTSGMLTGNITISDNGIDFKDALGQFKCALPLGEAYELNNESVRQKLTYRIVHLNGNTYLLSGLKVSDVNAMSFPVVIDPTITVYSTSNDGYLSNHSASYNTAWTALTGTISSTGNSLSIGQIAPGLQPQYYIYRGFVFFNTSRLPANAYIDNATLSLYKSGDFSTTDFKITVQNGQPTYPHSPMQTGDYSKTHYSGNGGALNTSGFVNGYNTIYLNSNGRSWMNRTGLTKLCLRSSRDINGNTPTSNEYVTVYANEQGMGYQPKLVITYRNQSKIKNTGSTNFKGYLLIQVQYNNSGTWVVDNEPVNETSPQTIDVGGQLALDRFFNGRIRASDLTHGAGMYRVYTAFRDPTGAVLKTETMSGGGVGSAELKAWWQFSKT
jgi:hypothetical protein